MAALIHIVDNDSSFQASLARLLRSWGYEVALHKSCEQFARETIDETGPSCLILEAQMPGMSGLELQRCLIERGSSLPVIFLTGHGDIPTCVTAIKTGAEDFLTKPVSKKMLTSAIEHALSNWRSNRDRSGANSLRALVCTLTSTERFVFEQVVRGKMSKQMAFDIGITERMVKVYRRRVMEKLRARNIAELVSVAERISAHRERPTWSKTGGNRETSQAR